MPELCLGATRLPSTPESFQDPRKETTEAHYWVGSGETMLGPQTQVSWTPLVAPAFPILSKSEQ